VETPETEGPRGRPGGEGALGVAFTPRLVDSVVDALVITDATGLILYANEALGRLLGYDVAKLFGTPFELLVREERRRSSRSVASSSSTPSTPPGSAPSGSGRAVPTDPRSPSTSRSLSSTPATARSSSSRSCGT